MGPELPNPFIPSYIVVAGNGIQWVFLFDTSPAIAKEVCE